MEPVAKRRRIEYDTTDFLKEDEEMCWESAFYPGDFIDPGRYAIWEQTLNPEDPEIEQFFRECEEAENVIRARSALRKPPAPSPASQPVNTNANNPTLLGNSNARQAALQRKLSANPNTTVHLPSSVIPPPVPLGYANNPNFKKNNTSVAMTASLQGPSSPPQIIQIPMSSISPSSPSSPPSPPLLQTAYAIDQSTGALLTPHGAPHVPGFFTAQHLMFPAQMFMWNPNPAIANLPPAKQQTPSMSQPGSPTRRGHVPASLNGISADGTPMERTTKNVIGTKKKPASTREEIKAPFLKRKRASPTSASTATSGSATVGKVVAGPSSFMHSVNRVPQPQGIVMFS